MLSHFCSMYRVKLPEQTFIAKKKTQIKTFLRSHISYQCISFNCNIISSKKKKINVRMFAVSKNILKA